MCTKRNIDDVLKQFKEGQQEPDHMRRLLEEANLCTRCPENIMGYGEQEIDCHCRQHFRIELQNYYCSIMQQKK
jgi:hypothetical protein